MYQHQHNQPQIKQSLPTITVQNSNNTNNSSTVTWHMSQPVQIWSQSASKWCPGEISYITQDADGYCLDVRYWAKPQLPKAKYLAPLSSCLRPISTEFTCRTDWTSGSKVECFSNSQKRWYKATVVDVIRYPDDKEDWLKIQWSLDIAHASNNAININVTPTSANSNAPQIMSKEVGRSSIWIRHRYPSFKNQSPPNMDATPKESVIQRTPNRKKVKKQKSKKKFKREKDGANAILPMQNVQSNDSKDLDRGNNRGKEISYTIPDSYNNSNAIRKFDAHTQSQNHSYISEDMNDYNGPPLPSKSKVVSSESQHFSHLTPQLSPKKNDEHMFDYILDKMSPNISDDKDKSENDPKNEGSPEFGAEFKPKEYKQKANMKELDLEMEKAFMQSDSEEDSNDSNDDSQDSNDYSNDGSVVYKNSENEEDSHSDSEDSNESSDDDAKNDKPLIPQSETRKAESTGNSWDEEKKELTQEIEELKFRLQIAEQDLNEERETSGPLLKEVEMQKIRIAKLEENITKLQRKYLYSNHGSANDLSPVTGSATASPTPNGDEASDQSTELKEQNNEEMTAKLEEFKKTLATPGKGKGKSKRHQRSQSFTSQSGSMLSFNSDLNSGSNGDLNSGKKNRFDGLKAQELIDAIYDRKVTLLNDQILRVQSDLKKKDTKICEYKAKDKLRKREIQLLESELSDIKNQNHAKSRSDTQNISMYRDQVRKLTQTNDALKKTLQTSDDKLKSAELKKQDLSEEFKIQRQITNTLQQKVQRVLQQNNTISAQVELLHQIQQSTPSSHSHSHSHNRHYSNSAAHNHLDTIRKCNMRAIQILHEIIEKNRRKRSDGYALNKYSVQNRESNSTPYPSQSNKRKSKAEEHGLYNQSRNVLMNYSGDDTHNNDDGDYERYHCTKSTRFSEKKGQKRGGSYNSAHNNSTPNTLSNQRFDFADGSIGSLGNDPLSTRASRGYMQPQQTHHQQRSEQMMHNMQPLVLRDKDTQLLSVDENNMAGQATNGSGNEYSARRKRVSYDYVDGNQMQVKYQQKKQKLYMNQMAHSQPAFDENEEDQYQDNDIFYGGDHQITKESNGNGTHKSHSDISAYFEKLWTVKFPRRSSKVQLFGGNKGHKTRIAMENKYLTFKCEGTNNNLVTKINVIEIKNYEITEKKNLSIFTKNGKKYKIKCEFEKEAHFWYNILTQFIQSNIGN